MHKSIAAALAAGLAVAALWAGITWLSGWSLGILALFVGTAVGLAFRIVARDRTSRTSGLIAAAIALACIVVGKYASASIDAHAQVAEYATDSAGSVDEDIIAGIADEMVVAREESGEEFEWPDTDSDDLADSYPAGMWESAERFFNTMSEEDKAARRAEYNGGSADAVGTISLIYFLFSFGPTGLIIVGLSVAGAYKIASGHEKTEGPAPAAAPVFSGGSPLRGMPAASADAPSKRDAA